MKDFARFIQARLRAARRSGAPRAEPSPERIPPGQRAVTHFPVLDLGTRPRVRREAWSLRLDGEVTRAVDLDWATLAELSQVDITADIHCVTRWSRLDTRWRGVRARDVIALAAPLETARFVTLHGSDGYTTNLPLAALLDDDVLFAHAVDGRPLPREHGGPVRLVVPRRYFWKSAKWVNRLEFHAEDRPGFWETRGYHNDGDPWREERFGGKR